MVFLWFSYGFPIKFLQIMTHHNQSQSALPTSNLITAQGVQLAQFSEANHPKHQGFGVSWHFFFHNFTVRKPFVQDRETSNPWDGRFASRLFFKHRLACVSPYGPRAWNFVDGEAHSNQPGTVGDGVAQNLLALQFVKVRRSNHTKTVQPAILQPYYNHIPSILYNMCFLFTILQPYSNHISQTPIFGAIF